MAVLGMVVIIRGLKPLANPFIPSLAWIVFAASTRPLPTQCQILENVLPNSEPTHNFVYVNQRRSPWFVVES